MQLLRHQGTTTDIGPATDFLRTRLSSDVTGGSVGVPQSVAKPINGRIRVEGGIRHSHFPPSSGAWWLATIVEATVHRGRTGARRQ